MEKRTSKKTSSRTSNKTKRPAKSPRHTSKAPAKPDRKSPNTPPAPKGANTTIVHAVGRHNVQFVMTDMDLTLTDAFWAYFVPTMESEVPRIAKIIGEPDLDKISREIGRVVNEYGTHEYPWLLELTWIRERFKGNAQEFEAQIAGPFWAALAQNRLRYSQAYPFVKETLVALREAGIPVVIVSDGPMYMVLARAKQTGLDELVDGIYALETVEPGPDCGLPAEYLEAGRKRVAQLMGTNVACKFRV
ncbi:MAG: HAD family hydrolase, partial [Candidatus Obscuribacterales bacterium]|nr:HAD family hydrolase [Candidatus Obscuribacterales bacterium]